MAVKSSHLLLFGDNFPRPVGTVAGSRVLSLPVLLKLLLLPQELRVLKCSVLHLLSNKNCVFSSHVAATSKAKAKRLQ